MKPLFKTVSLTFLLTIALAVPYIAQAEEPKQTLFTNVNVFDGFSDKLAKNLSVLVEDDHIVKVAKSIEAPGATIIDGGGRTMTPGLIDMHQHVMLNPPEGTAAYQTRWDDAAGGAICTAGAHAGRLASGSPSAAYTCAAFVGPG